MQFSVQHSPLFWLVGAMVALGAIVFAAFFGAVLLLLRQRILKHGFPRYLGAVMLLALFFLNAGGGWIYSANDYYATASFRVNHSGISWTNWTRRPVYPWSAIKSLTLKRGNKGHDILQFRYVKNAQESGTFEIDSQNTGNFAALVRWAEKSTHLAARRLQ